MFRGVVVIGEIDFDFVVDVGVMLIRLWCLLGMDGVVVVVVALMVCIVFL